MEITTTTINRNQDRRAAVNALALVGFIALILIGIGLAIYSARYMPKIASKFGGAAASLSSIFHSADENPSLQVVTATTTLPIIDDVASTTVTATTTSGSTHTGTKTAGTKTSTTVTTIKTEPVAPYGDPDLSVRITAVGYLSRSGDTDSFVESGEVPSGKNGAVKFTVNNTGTNVTGSWKFQASVPTSPSQNFTSPTQRSLNPGDSIDFVLGFQKGKKGNDRDIVVTVDSSKTVSESNERNNEDSHSIDIRD